MTVKNPDTSSSTNINNVPRPKKKRGRPKGLKKDITPAWKQEQMYLAWAAGGTLNHVSDVCGVSSRTAARYKEKNNWIERKALEVQKIEAAIALTGGEGTELEQAINRAVSGLEIVAELAHEACITEKFTKPEQAWKVYKEALELILDLKGRTTGKTLNLILYAAQRFQDEPKADPKDITDSASVSDADASD